ncbi:MAG: hypothetical protein Q8880_07495, partial [Bacteroidota bacterium]|nr:hypothetical protein [Bacteroidota bacterium]
MSNYKTDKCLITGLHAEDCDVALVCGWSYYIKTVNNKKRLIIIDKDFEQFKEGEFFKSNKHIFAGAIINDQLNEIDSPNVDISLNYLIKKLPQLIYPKTPKEKMDNLLRTLVSKQSY